MANGDHAAPSALDHGLPPPQELRPSQSLLSSLLLLVIRSLFGQSFSVALPILALRGLLCLGSFSVVWCIRHIEGSVTAVLLCRLVHRSLKGGHWVGSYSVVQCVRCLMGQPLYCSAASAGMWGERGYGDGSTPLHMTRQYCLGSMAAPLSSTGISHHKLIPHIPQSVSPQ